MISALGNTASPACVASNPKSSWVQTGMTKLLAYRHTIRTVPMAVPMLNEKFFITLSSTAGDLALSSQ
jgi:hypothetical protein